MQSLLKDTVIAPTTSPGGVTSGLRDLWNIVEQAGTLRWPILGVLAIGLALAIGKFYDLLRDRSVSRTLAELDLKAAGMDDVRKRVAAQQESMLASLYSSMLNLFATRSADGMLHDEIANFVAGQQGQFGVFRRRMEFLSDTAGALGLLGTVWGMFVVFFQGTSDKAVILQGMGIALITTLMGLVVSMVLNLCTTEMSTFFGKRLDQVTKQADQLRFRLLELAATPARAAPPAPVPHPPPAPVSPPGPPAPQPAIAKVAPDNRGGGDRPAVWYDLEADPAEYVARAGEARRDLKLTLRRNGGAPAAGVPVAIAVQPGAGALEGGQTAIRRDTDREGRIGFEWNAPERTGSFALDVSVVGQPGSGRVIHLRVIAGAPHRADREGNHQAAIAGMRLPRPLGVTLRDRFGNGVPGVPVKFSVKAGGGRLGQHTGAVDLTSDADGSARTAFAVSDVPGPNVVIATMDGQPPLEFVAFGTEV